MARKWTEDQLKAIYAKWRDKEKTKSSNILVNAAAGSGKTAVLVERIINKVINENVDIDKMLVVTFTNAAASEMRERILDAIYKKLEENPDSINLQRQITLLNKASICTIHSFCLDVIRNNFYEIDTSANFRIGDTAEIEMLKADVLEELFEQKYMENDEKFIKLIETYTDYTNALYYDRYNIFSNNNFAVEQYDMIPGMDVSTVQEGYEDTITMTQNVLEDKTTNLNC